MLSRRIFPDVLIALMALAIFDSSVRSDPPLNNAPATRPAEDEDPDLVARWTGKNAADECAPDQTGHKHDGHLIGAKKIVTESVDDRNAIRVGRNFGTLSAGPVADFDFTRDFTVALFVRFDDNPKNCTLLSKCTDKDGYSLVVNVDDRWGFAFVGSIRPVVTAKIIRPREWYHLAVTYHDSRYLLYVDGRAIGTLLCADTVPASQAPLVIGGAGALTTEGWIDDVRIYHRALSDDDLRNLKRGEPIASPYTQLSKNEKQDVRALVEKLGASASADREHAQKSLQEMGRKIYPILREFRGSPDAEIRSRVGEILGDTGKAVEPPPTVEPGEVPLDPMDLIFPLLR